MNSEFKVSPVFLVNKRAFHNERYKIMCNQGGTRSGKTYSIIQLLCVTAGFVPNIMISIVSKTFPHLRRGAIRDFREIMQNIGAWEEKRFNKTESIYTFKNGTCIEFFSADNDEKLRGPGRDILFINEANLLSIDEWHQLLWRTKSKVFLDYNPADEECWIYDKVIPRADCKFIKSTYLENYDFLPKSQIEEIERLKDEDPTMWAIYGKGDIARATNLIYNNFEIRRLTVNADPIYGLDFGFNNPTALTELKIKPEDKCVSVNQILYERGLTNSDLIEKLKILIPNKNDFIYADCAEPQRIQEIYDHGFNILPADKSVKTGIDFCKRFKFIIDPGGIELQKEIKSYKWKSDKNGRVLDEPVKFNDHAIDSIRYALFTFGQEYLQEADFVLPSAFSKATKKQSIFASR